MQRLIEPEAIELDPETQAAVDEVCGALADPWLEGDYRNLRFAEKWWRAYRNSADHECRQRIIEACDQIVRSDPDVWMSASEDGIPGPVIPRTTIGQYDGRLVYETDAETGEMSQILQWPTGYFAGGNPDYTRREAA